jgi:hypothetical protein
MISNNGCYSSSREIVNLEKGYYIFEFCMNFYVDSGAYARTRGRGILITNTI